MATRKPESQQRPGRLSDARLSDSRFSDSRLSDPRAADPRFSKNDQHVRVHYNTVKNDTRSHTRMMPLRDFNNFIKWLLIFEYSQPHDVVLDMACGKGGDLEKWRRASIDGWIGVDIADQSIEDAKMRFQRLRPKTFWADFVVGNCFGADLQKTALHEDTPLVDVISCQFALHYAFDTRERINTTFANVSAQLKPGGLFIGTMPNPDYLAQNLQKCLTHNKKRDWGNSLFHVTFDDDVELTSDGQFAKPIGNGYRFYLSEAVDNVQEYVVPLDVLAEIAKSHGLEIILKEPFLEYFKRWVHESELVLHEANFKKLADRHGNPSFPKDQLEVCSIYLCFGFRKV